MSELVGDVALVTGGAGAIGRTIVDRLADSGAAIAVLDLAGAEEAAAGVVARGGRALGITVDVRHEEQVDGAVQRVVNELGVPSLLVTSAGVLRTARLFKLTPEEWDLVFETNVTGRFLTGRAVARAMIAAGTGGSIVNIGSITSELVAPGRIHYCTSNAAIAMLSHAMALDLGRHGIRVNTISAGPVDTPMLGGRSQDAERLQRFLERIPLRRLGTADDVADAAVFLASREASYITGSTMYLDGGWLAG